MSRPGPDRNNQTRQQLFIIKAEVFIQGKAVYVLLVLSSPRPQPSTVNLFAEFFRNHGSQGPSLLIRNVRRQFRFCHFLYLLFNPGH
jgi:hypothetical protein